MVCDKYKEALIDSAASGAALASDVSEHVQVCTTCKEMFAAQQALFMLVEAGLRSQANVRVPANFDHRLRAALQTHVPVTRRRRWWVLTAGSLAAAAAILIAFLLAQPAKHGANGTGATAVIGSKPLPGTQAPVLERDEEDNRSGQIIRAGSPRRIVSRAGVLNSAAFKAPDEQNAAAEVLVPHGQQELLTKYMEQIGARKGRVSITAELEHEPEMKPMEVPAVEISKLVVSPLPDLSSK
jgi:hypothetical protein